MVCLNVYLVCKNLPQRFFISLCGIFVIWIKKQSYIIADAVCKGGIIQMELIRNSVACYDIILDKLSTYEESTDAIVPDTYPDIARIAYADGMVNMKEESPQNDRILVSGTVNTSVLYQPEGENTLKRLDVPVSFAYIEEIRGCNSESKCFVRCTVANVKAHAVNSRKMSVTVRLCFEITAYQKGELCFTQSIQPSNEQLEVLYQNNEISLLKQVQNCEFTVLDDIEWKHSEDLELLHTDCNVRQTEVRANNGRLLLRGEASMQMLMRDDTGSIEQVSKIVPFTQMIDMEGITEGEKLDVRLAVCSLDCVLAPDDILSVGIGVRATVLGDQVHTVQTIRDLYERKHQLQVQIKQVPVQTCKLGGRFSADGADTIPIGMKVMQYLSSKAVCTGIQIESSEQARIKTEVDILYLDEENSLFQTHRTVHFPIKLSSPEGVSPSDIQVNITISPSSEDSVSIYANAVGAYCGRKKQTIQDITAVTLGAEREKTMSGVTLVLRRVDEGEQLWDIARQYATTMSAIRNANNLSGDAQPAKEQMLLIPLEQ